MRALKLDTEKWTKYHWAAYHSQLGSILQAEAEMNRMFANPALSECGVTPFFVALLASDFDQLNELMEICAMYRLFDPKYSTPPIFSPVIRETKENLIEDRLNPSGRISKSKFGLELPNAIYAPQKYIDLLSEKIFHNGPPWRYYAGVLNELENFGTLSTNKDVWRCKVDDETIPLQGAIIGGNLHSVIANNLPQEAKEWRSQSTGETIYHIAAKYKVLALLVEKFGNVTKQKDFLAVDNSGHTPFNLAFFNGTLEQVDYHALDPNSSEICTALQDLETWDKNSTHFWRKSPDLPTEVTRVRKILHEYSLNRIRQTQELLKTKFS